MPPSGGRSASCASGPPPRPRSAPAGSERASPVRGRSGSGAPEGCCDSIASGSPARTPARRRAHARRRRGRSRPGTHARRRGPRARSGQRPRARSRAAGPSAAQGPTVLALVVLAVLATADRLPPPFVVPIPLHGPLQPLAKPEARLPAELVTELLAAQRVAAVGGRP